MLKQKVLANAKIVRQGQVILRVVPLHVKSVRLGHISMGGCAHVLLVQQEGMRLHRDPVNANYVLPGKLPTQTIRGVNRHKFT